MSRPITQYKELAGGIHPDVDTVLGTLEGQDRPAPEQLHTLADLIHTHHQVAVNIVVGPSHVMSCTPPAATRTFLAEQMVRVDLPSLGSLQGVQLPPPRQPVKSFNEQRTGYEAVVFTLTMNPYRMASQGMSHPEIAQCLSISLAHAKAIVYLNRGVDIMDGLLRDTRKTPVEPAQATKMAVERGVLKQVATSDPTEDDAGDIATQVLSKLSAPGLVDVKVVTPRVKSAVLEVIILYGVGVLIIAQMYSLILLLLRAAKLVYWTILIPIKFVIWVVKFIYSLFNYNIVRELPDNQANKNMKVAMNRMLAITHMTETPA